MAASKIPADSGLSKAFFEELKQSIALITDLGLVVGADTVTALNTAIQNEINVR